MELKGRIIGAMNFITWIGIVSASGFYWLCSTAFPRLGMPTSWTFATLGVLMFAIAILFPPKSQSNPTANNRRGNHNAAAGESE